MRPVSGYDTFRLNLIKAYNLSVVSFQTASFKTTEGGKNKNSLPIENSTYLTGSAGAERIIIMDGDGADEAEIQMSDLSIDEVVAVLFFFPANSNSKLHDKCVLFKNGNKANHCIANVNKSTT